MSFYAPRKGKVHIDLTVDLEKWKFVNGCKDV